MADVGKSQRDAIKQISPPFLSGGIGEKFLYNIGLASDALLDRMDQAMRAHMPGRCDASALPILGTDRVLAQGPNESNADFAQRLKKAFDAWQHAGSSRAVLQQALAYVANPLNAQPNKTPAGAIVHASTSGSYATWDVFYSGDVTSQPPHHQRVASANWNWDGNYTWWQSFLILYFPLLLSSTTGTAASITGLTNGFLTVSGLTGMTPSAVGGALVITGASNSANNGTFIVAQYLSATSVVIANPRGAAPDANNGAISWTLGSWPAVGPDLPWDAPGTTWDDGGAWGLNVSPSYVAGLRALLRLWKSANTHYPWIIFSFATNDGTTGKEFSPLSSQGSGNPDGTWATWAKTSAGVSVRARVTNASTGGFDEFCDGSALYTSSAWAALTT